MQPPNHKRMSNIKLPLIAHPVLPLILLINIHHHFFERCPSSDKNPPFFSLLACVPARLLKNTVAIFTYIYR